MGAGMEKLRGGKLRETKLVVMTCSGSEEPEEEGKGHRPVSGFGDQRGLPDG